MDDTDWLEIFDALGGMICILDHTGRIVRVNRTFCTLLGKSPEALEGTQGEEVISALHTAPGAQLTKILPHVGQQLHTERFVEIKGVKFAESVVPFVTEEGKQHWTAHVYRDTMQQDRFRDALIQSEKMAAIRRLASEIAHEINNPLLYISNYLYLIADELPAEFSGREYLERIQKGVDNLTFMTRELLEFSRPLLISFSPVDIHEMIDSLLDKMNIAFADKQVNVVRDYACCAPVVNGSRELLQQAIEILVQNAIDAVSTTGTICISTSCTDEHISLHIKDSGAGISSENLMRIFDPFFTTKSGLSGKRAGLGLALCYNIIYQHHGEITVVSREKDGTTFSILLPVEQERT